MGVFKVTAKVWQISRQSAWKEIELVVDTGATYTTLPSSFLESLGVKRVRKTRLTIADGRSVDREIGEVGIEVNEKRATSTPVVFGDREIFLLGSVTLEELSLAPDPVRKKLVPAEAYLLVSARRNALKNI